MNKRIFTLAPLSLAMLLAGCSIAPQPMSVQELDTRMRDDRIRMFANQPQRIENLTLEQAIDMAVNNNFDLRQKMMEEAIANRQLDLAHYDMLPELAASAGYTSRSNQALSRSVDANGNASNTFSTSQDRDITTASLSTVWNVLDFGVSYYQAQQSADQVLIAEQRRRKIVQNLVQQVRSMYWNAVGAQYLQSKVDPLLINAREALAKAEKVGAEQLMNPLDSLRYRKDLLEIIRQLEGLRDELSKARPELATLLGLAPGTNLELAVPAQFTLLQPELKYSLEEMEDIALSSRPELIEANYQRRISALDTRKAMVRLLPGIEVDLGHYYDSNSFLENSDWSQGGVRISWNLFNLLRGPKDVDLAKAREALVDSQRMAMNMAVLSQVHVSWLDYQSLSREYDRARELSEIGTEIHARMKDRQAGSVQSRMEEIKSATSALTEELRMFRAYAGLQEAYGRVKATLGKDDMNDVVGGFSIPEQSPVVVEQQPDTEQAVAAVIPETPEYDAEQASAELLATIDRWADAWRNKDVSTYLNQYTSDFPGNARAHSRWAKERSMRLQEPRYIELELDKTMIQEQSADAAMVSFEQLYKSNLYNDRVRKVLRLKREQDEWKIVAEVAQDR
ncbi:TolC family protein [Pontibacterium sp. N1Y112]|uniref:TolC family protein n=1 Tax=Pontibacterium sinense TaxID=2781979 RepID=A0A8J7JWV0_9GAMM|nr:TolC family protein [Pontibacterium sinense]MBE9395643.1 TolC family protein [Pontibacterium sinense]